MSGEIGFRPAGPGDRGIILALYNGNLRFLRHHLGVARVDGAFLEQEEAEMAQMGFVTWLMTEGDRVVGFSDLRPGREVYLSLFLVDGACQGHGLGRRLYCRLEEALAALGGKRVRIDVVDDHPENSLPFWEKLGFCKEERVSLTWGKKTSGGWRMTRALPAGAAGGSGQEEKGMVRG